MFQLILNPIRDWNRIAIGRLISASVFQLILNPIRDWNKEIRFNSKLVYKVPINLKPY